MNPTLQNGKGSWSKREGIHFVNISLILVKCLLMLEMDSNDGEIENYNVAISTLQECRKVLENGIEVDFKEIK
jgi:hypothetical protein